MLWSASESGGIVMTSAVSTFDTIEPNLGEILAKVKSGKIQLPDFQRGWVWDDNRIRALIASVSRSYPIGAITAMEVSNSIRFLPRPFEGVSLRSSVNPDVLVLDGQQRLTSLYLSLLSKKAVPTTTEKKQEIERFYYFDMERCLDPSADRFDAVVSVPVTRQVTSDFGRKIDLDVSTRELEYDAGMIPLNLIFDTSGYAEWQQGFMQHFSYDPEKIQFFNRFNMEIWLRFQQYKIPVIKLSKDTPKEAVCQVFENVNTGGVSLTVFELMTATYAADGFQLRKDWNERKKHLYDNNVLQGVDESAFLTAVTLLTSYKNNLSDKKAVSCKRKDILNLPLESYRENADLIVAGMQSAAKLLAREKIFDRRNLPYQTQLIPLSAICAYLGNRVENDAVKEKLARWYWCGVFGELYGGANESRYALDIQGVIRWLDGGEIPATVRDANFSPTRLLTLQTRLSAAYKGLMALLMKEGSKDFISGDSIELTTYFDNAIDIHHIFPAAYCQKQKFERSKWNSVINKTPLSSRTNRVLGGHKPSTYIQTIQDQHNVNPARLDRIFKTHAIDPGHIRSDDFSGFILQRARALLDMIEEVTGKTIAGRDSEEVTIAFGDTLLST